MKKRFKDFVLIMGYSIFMILTSVMLLFCSRKFTKENAENILCIKKQLSDDEFIKVFLAITFTLFITIVIFLIVSIIFWNIIFGLFAFLLFVILIWFIYDGIIKSFRDR